MIPRFCHFLSCITFVLLPNEIWGIQHQLNITYANVGTQSFDTDQSLLASDDLVNQTCNAGVWLLHENANFSGDGWVQLLYNIEGDCVDPSMPGIKSIRSVGVEENASLPSVTFFTGDFTSGQAIITEEGISNIDFSVNSLVSVNAQVEFYLEEDYGGDFFCLQPSSCFQEGSVCVVWDWTYVPELPWEISLARSARLGCTDGKIVTSVQTPMKIFHQNLFNL